MMAELRVVGSRISRKLPAPMTFGKFTVSERTYCTVEVAIDDGRHGVAATLDRGVDVSDIVNRIVGPAYQHLPIEEPLECWRRVLRLHSPALSSGAGLRALSLVDLALHDALGRVPAFASPPPVWVIVGYPPTADADEVQDEARLADLAGAAGVKLPVSRDVGFTRSRLEGALSALGPGRVALDLAWSCENVEEALEYVSGLNLAWVEDPFPPGQAAELADLRRRLDIPLASGDEEGHLYHPDPLIWAEAVDIVRMDATCQGGLSRFADAVERGIEVAAPISWHMNARWNIAAAAVLGAAPLSVEVSGPGSGVDPLAETRPLALAVADPSGV
jgi:L-alanine-DL-glutamate epimerase-like enolase superfamily enzyme